MDNYLEHHGIKGQKWGVRRYQNKDGTLTAAGKKRVEETTKKESQSEQNKNIGRAAIAAATVTVAAMYVHENPEKIGQVVSKLAGVKMSDISSKVVNKGKEYVTNALKGAKEGVNEAVKEAPKKAAKAVVTGIVMNQTKSALDSVVGKEESAKIFQANDNKKIGKFWKVSPDDRDDDE
jgi:hypothetical protein